LFILEVARCDLCSQIGKGTHQADAALVTSALARSGKLDDQGFKDSIRSMCQAGVFFDKNLKPPEMLKCCAKCGLVLFSGMNCSVSQFKKIGLCFKCQGIPGTYVLTDFYEILLSQGKLGAIKAFKLTSIEYFDNEVSIDLRKWNGPRISIFTLGLLLDRQLNMADLIEQNLGFFQTNYRTLVCLKGKIFDFISILTNRQTLIVSGWLANGVGIIVDRIISDLSSVDLPVDGKIVGEATRGMDNDQSTYYVVSRLNDDFISSRGIIW